MFVTLHGAARGIAPGYPGRWLQGLSDATTAPDIPGTDSGKVGGVPDFRGLRDQTKPYTSLSPWWGIQKKSWLSEMVTEGGRKRREIT